MIQKLTTGMAALVVTMTGALPMAAETARTLEFKRLNSDEIGALLLGTKIGGTIHGRMTSWKGCIDPDGVTSREIDGGYITGQFTIRDDLACFAYEDEQSCFVVLQYDGGHMLYSGQVDFLIEEIKPDIDFCPIGSAGV